MDETNLVTASPRALSEHLGSRAANDRPAAPAALVGLEGGYLAYFLAALAHDLRAPLVIVMPDAQRAGLLEDGLAFFLGRGEGVRLFPAHDHLPFSGMSPARTQTLLRMGALARLGEASPGSPASNAPADVIIVPASALLDQLPPTHHITGNRLSLEPGDLINRESLVAFLVTTGYHRVPSVEDMGSFAVRGELIDIWPVLSDEPIRVELFDDEIERLRPFDPATQQSAGAPLPRLVITPAREVALTADTLALARARLTTLADERHVPSSRLRALLSDLEHQILPVGLEELLPAFHAELHTLFDHVPAKAHWLVVDPPAVHAAILDRYIDLGQRHGRADSKEGDLVFPLASLYGTDESTTAALDVRTAARFQPFFLAGDRTGPRFIANATSMADLRKDLTHAVEQGETNVLRPLLSRISAWRNDGAAVVLAAHTAGGLERLDTLLAPYGLTPTRVTDVAPHKLASLRASSVPLHVVIGTPGEGFCAIDEGLVLIDEAEILGRPARPRRRQKKSQTDNILKSYRDLKIGDLVVHLTHGVGRYRGLRELEVGENLVSEVLEIEYADKNTLLVPVDKLHLVSRHQGGDGAPSLDKLGGQGQAAWNKTKSRVKKAVRDIADHLLKLYAEREASKGYAFSQPDELYHRFEAAFPFEETPDQIAAIEETIHDMTRQRPMDRLVCGDVGFGKTEVAIRAAMKCVADGKQVAVLVPTQVLAEQHRISFTRRFESFPVTIESLSAMRSAAKQKEIVAATGIGNVDILIGTHRLLSKDLKFKNLGLLIIDEEHRFGVAQKEHVKRYKANVDVLTLTATPIPRTLHMSMLGLRDISLIQTPPVDRLPVQTFVSQPSEEVITEAIRRELARGGQVFFIHHRVFDIEKQAELINALVPEARIAVGHGQMPEGQLEKVMMRFVSGEANVLVATTIVESGIDIPNANTILINRADCFGLAQLYQLRGRVGRSATRAFCFLLVPSPHALAGDAADRLAAIQRFSELGSGYSVASHDLDIRGAGDLLGADQAGNIDAVGYDAFMELLQQAIGEVRSEKTGEPPPTDIDCEIKIPVDARIPETWLPDTALRLRLYRAFAGAKTHDELAQILGVAVDRYGAPPAPVKHLAAIMAVKLDAKALALTSISIGKDKLVIGLSGEGKLQPIIAAAFIAERARTSRNAQTYRMTPDGKLHLPAPLVNGTNAGPDFVRETLRTLTDFAEAYGKNPPPTLVSTSSSSVSLPPPPPARTPGARPPEPPRREGPPTRRVFIPGPRRR